MPLWRRRWARGWKSSSPNRRPQRRPLKCRFATAARFGEDLEELAQSHALSVGEVIALHTAPLYRVQMLGFAPGFAYLAGLDDALATARKSTPRTSVPAGSVAIGGELTGIYPLDLPGGWHIIGRSPVKLFDPNADPPTPFSVGDRVRFIAVTAEEYQRLLREGRWR